MKVGPLCYKPAQCVYTQSEFSAPAIELADFLENNFRAINDYALERKYLQNLLNDISFITVLFGMDTEKGYLHHRKYICDCTCKTSKILYNSSFDIIFLVET